MKWLIWSFEHRGWWGPNRCGYTRSPEVAGRYSLEEAQQIVTDANCWLEKDGLEGTPQETMCPDWMEDKPCAE